MAGRSDFLRAAQPPGRTQARLAYRYAHYFGGRAGRATAGRVAFIDGYAGEGRYLDGSPGSPLLLASQATRVEMLGRDVKLAFVEPDEARWQRLGQSLAEHDVVADQLRHDRLQDVVDELLDRYGDRATLLFLDPFGLGLSRGALERVLRRSSRTHPTDVLYHFSLSTVARMGPAGLLEGSEPGPNSRQLDEALGPIGRREVFEGTGGTRRATLAAFEVARRFGESIRQSTGRRSTSIPVRQRPDQLPKYLLTLFSSDDRAHWDFADLASSAYVDWLHRCDTDDYEANLQLNEAHGRQVLFRDPAPTRDDVDQRLQREADDYLPRHVEEVLRRRGTILPLQEIEEIYGEMLGRARITHLRAAIKALHAAGKTSDEGTGDFWLRTLRRTGT